MHPFQHSYDSQADILPTHSVSWVVRRCMGWCFAWLHSRSPPIFVCRCANVQECSRKWTEFVHHSGALGVWALAQSLRILTMACILESGIRAAVPPTLKRVVRRVPVELNKREEAGLMIR